MNICNQSLEVFAKEADRLVNQEALDWGGEEAWCEGEKRNADHVERLCWILDWFRCARAPVIEVGSGSGYITHRLRGRGVKAYGVEVSQRWLHFAASKYGGFYLSGLAERLPFASGSCAGIILAEVLEHVLEPVCALREAYRVSCKGSLWCVTIPATWHSIDEPDHRRFLDASQIWNLLVSEKFIPSVQRSNQHFRFLAGSIG